MVANNQRGRHQGEQLVAVLHHGKMPCGCPLYLQKRTLEPSRGMSALCHERTHAPQQKASLFDDLIGNSEHLGRDVEA